MLTQINVKIASLTLTFKSFNTVDCLRDSGREFYVAGPETPVGPHDSGRLYRLSFG